MKTKLYKRGKWYWLYYRENGRTVQRSLRTDDLLKAEIDQRETELRLLGQPSNRIAPVSVEAFKQHFLEWARRERRPGTASKYESVLKDFFEVCPYAHIGDFALSDAERFKAVLLERDLAPATVNISLRHLKAAFGKAELWQMLDRNPFWRVPMLRVERRQPRFLSADQMRALLEAMVAHPPYDLIVCLCALCGMRRGEMAAAIWEWFDFPARTVTICGRKDFKVKDWEARTVPLSSWALSILEPRRRKRGYVVRWPHGRKNSVLWVYQTWKGLLKHAKLPHVTFQQLRSTFGSLYLQQGVSLSKIALWMGHSSEDVTRRHYAALTAYDDDIEKLTI